MNRRSIAILGVVCVLAVPFALWVVDRSTPEIDSERHSALVPGLESAMNDIEAIDIVSLDGKPVATLRRERARWLLREKHDHEADFDRIHELLRNLAGARREAERTANPQWYPRLGVEAVGEGDSGRAAVRFPEADLPGVIIGETDPAGVGRYVRLEGEAQTWLTGARLDVPVERLQWLQRAIMDIPAADMRAVTIRHPDGETVSLRPGDAEGSVWVLLNAPRDREVSQSWQLRQRANGLAALNLVDVRPHEAGRVPEDAVEAEFLTRDGLRFTARLFEDEARHWVHFRVSEAGEDASQTGMATDSGQSADTEQAELDRSVDAVAIDGRLSPWQYAIEEQRYDRLTVRTEALLVPPEETPQD